MKHFYFFSTFILISLFSFSQTYKLEVKKIYSWDTNETPSTWKHDVTEQYSYDNGGNKETKIIGYQIPSMEMIYQTTKTYDSNNNITLSVQQFWNDSSMEWINGYKVMYVYYNGSNNLMEETRQTYNLLTMEYQNSSKVYYEYNGLDMTVQIDQTWDEGMSTWVNEDKLEISYTNGLASKGLFSEWNSGGGMWEVEERIMRSYNMNDLPEEDFGETWNGSGWDNSEKTNYTYMGLLQTEQLSQNWNGSSWEDSDRALSEYNNGNRSVFTYENWDVGMDKWIPEYKEETTYSMADPLSTSTFGAGSFKVFPNPVSTVVNIKSAGTINEVELFNILGEKVMSTNRVNQLNVEGLKSGMYLLRIDIDNHTFSRKLIVK
ncbi:T9SS type A sorting domain-containing protein [uncultured Algibacter sp.]|uniref:T9SS type A sorting domain-containing protein n=1 Tax=uncultured Algibacter sp. TaxID=298659 RepID=UPI0026230A23|nr:T9SS type A sorting domain-containing protein [uncultured Algibacter sp.]